MRWRSCLSACVAALAVASGVLAVGAATIVVNPGESIQAAINAAASGDTIAVAAGTYSGSLTVNKTLTIVGDAGCKIQGTGSGNGFLIQAAEVTLDGFEVTGFAIGVRSYGGIGTNYGALTVRNANLHHNSQNGVLLVYDTFSSVSIENSTIASNTQNGIGIGNGAKLGALNLSGTVVQGNKNSGIYIANSGTTISSGSFSGVTLASNSWQGLHVEGGASFSNVTISGGAIQGNQFGIVTKTSTITNLALDGVAVENNTGSGLTFTGTVTGLTIEDCVFAGNAWEHIDLGLSWMGSLALSNCVVRGNVFGDGPWYSVYVQSATFASGQLLVTQNEFLKAWSYGVCNTTGNLVLAYNNWWGHANGPNVVAYKSANVDYSPWLANGIAAGTWLFVVDDVGPVGTAGYLQPALDAAQDGDTVHVRGGSYVTQGLIHSGIVLEGEAGAFIKAPGGGRTYTVDESTNTFDPILFAYGGVMTGTHVSGSARIQADILGFDIDGQNQAQAGPRFVGILLRNVDGTVSGNAIHDMYDADGQGNGPETFGILVYGDSDAIISGNAISEFSRGGIVARGDDGAAADPDVLIQGNTVTGNGSEAGTNWWAENGIQISGGATGEIIGNTVLNCSVNNPNWSASGILVVGSSNVLVSGNTTSGSDNGIAVGGPAVGTVLTGNDVIGNTYGIALQGDATGTQIIGNVVTGSLSDGIYVYSFGGGLPVGTVARYNAISGNVNGLVNYETAYGSPTVSVDAALNWWGSGDGPAYDGDFDGVPEVAGSGDSIYGEVIFSPWLGTNPDGNPALAGVQIAGPMLIVVGAVGPVPTGGYLNAAIDGSNGAVLTYEDTIEVLDGSFTASTPITDGVTLLSQNGTGATTINGSLLLDSASVIIGQMRQGFAFSGPITVGAGIDASTIHINWNDIYDIVSNGGAGWLDATYNFWGEDGPDTVGFVNVYPYLPVTTDTLIGYVDDYGYSVAEAIAFAQAIVDGATLSEAELIVLLGEEFGLSPEDAAALINDYGRAAVNRAAVASSDLLELMLHLVGYTASVPSAGGGGGAGGDVTSYPVGSVVPLFLALTDPFTGEAATNALVTYTLTRALEGGIPQIVRFGVMPYDPAAGGYAFAVDTTGLAAGEYDVYIGTDDGNYTTYRIVLTE